MRIFSGNTASIRPVPPGSRSRYRILYVVDSLGFGGTEKQLYLLLKHLDLSSFHPRVACLAEGGDWIERIRKLGIELVALRRNGSFDVNRLVSLAGILQRFRPDLVHSFQPHANLYAGLASLITRAGRLIVSSRSYDPPRKEQSLLHRLLNRMTYRRADTVVCNSLSLQQDLMNRFGSKVSVRVIYNGIENLPACRPTRESLRQAIGLAPDRPVVGTIGRLVPIKNHRLFIDIASRIHSMRPDVQFLIIGDGPLKASLQEHAQRCGVARAVLFLGQLPDAEKWLNLLDVFVLTTGNGSGQGEGFPNVLMEAMLNGIPGVASKAGGTTELVVDGETGYLVEAQNPEAYVQPIVKLLDDCSLREEMGIRAGEIVMQKYGVCRMKTQFQALYTALIVTGRPPVADSSGLLFLRQPLSHADFHRYHA